MSGESTLSIEMGFIKELKELCREANPEGDAKVVADCVFAHLDILSVNIGTGGNVADICESDLTGLTPERIAQVRAVCEGL
jgi:hypothetical protein